MPFLSLCPQEALFRSSTWVLNSRPISTTNVFTSTSSAGSQDPQWDVGGRGGLFPHRSDEQSRVAQILGADAVPRPRQYRTSLRTAGDSRRSRNVFLSRLGGGALSPAGSQGEGPGARNRMPQLLAPPHLHVVARGVSRRH